MPRHGWILRDEQGTPIGFACGRAPARKRCKCGQASTALCDFSTGAGATCDKPLCDRCRVRVGPDLDHCPDHAKPETMMNPTQAPVWRGRLPDLLPYLTAQLATSDRPKVQLPHGAYLGLSRRSNGQRVLRIARATRPKDEKGWRAWRLELDTFKKQLGLEGWAHAVQEPIAGVAAAFVEPAQEDLFPEVSPA